MSMPVENTFLTFGLVGLFFDPKSQQIKDRRRVDIHVHRFPFHILFIHMFTGPVDMKEVRPATVERLAWAMSTLRLLR